MGNRFRRSRRKYKSDTEKWEKVMDRKRDQVQDQIDSHIQDLIIQCIEEKEENFDPNENTDDDNFNGYRYSFEMNGTNYRVEFVDIEHEDMYKITKEAIPDPELVNKFLSVVRDKAFTIQFEGPKKFKSTKDKGSTAFKIYTEVVRAIETIIRKHNAVLLQYLPYEPGMASIYDKLSRNYLQNLFVMIEPNVWLLKTVLEEIGLNSHPEINSRLSQVQDKYSKELEKANAIKKINMIVKRDKDNVYGKVVMAEYKGRILPGFIETISGASATINFPSYLSIDVPLDKLSPITSQFQLEDLEFELSKFSLDWRRSFPEKHIPLAANHPLFTLLNLTS